MSDDRTPSAPDPAPPQLSSDSERLWSAFVGELADHESWDHEFTPSPYDPGKALIAFLDSAKSSAAPVFIDAIRRNEDTPLTYWACSGLQSLGLAAGPEAAAALEARASAEKSIYWPAAIALESVDPERARAANFERDPSALSHLLQFHLGRGMESVCQFLDRVIDRGDTATIERTLKNMFLRDAVTKNLPAPFAERLRVLSKTHLNSAVRSAAANLLAEAKSPDASSQLISTLAKSGSVGAGAIERFACHPDSECFVESLVSEANVYTLGDLLLRRRCAGWVTNPAPMRALLAEKLERPKREWRYEEHDVHQAALCVAELQDTELIGSLIKAVVPENSGFAWEPLVRAFRALGEPARDALQSAIADCPPGERRTRLELMLGILAMPRTPVKQSLGYADDTFLRGRIEPTVWGAFRAYGNILLEAPSAHAAFQLAWIDRAFGSEIVPARVNWIRSLGFYDDELLAQLTIPVTAPLTGYRSGWDAGETQKRDPKRAEQVEQAGLPSLAARWNRDERYVAAAKEQIERVRRAVASRRRKAKAPKYIAISDCEICRELKEYERAYWRLVDWEEPATELPPAAARLLNHERCPICGTFYKHTVRNDFQIGGNEDEEILTRRTFAEARASLTASEYDSIMRWMPSNLTHSNAATRHFAAKCLVAHHLARGETGAVESYLVHAGQDVVLGALSFLADVSDRSENRAVLLALLDRFAELMASPVEKVSWTAAGIVRDLSRPAKG